jgi:hypothetical protein
LIGSSTAATASVVGDGNSAPNTRKPRLLPTASQRSGIMVRTRAPAAAKPTASAPAA